MSGSGRKNGSGKKRRTPPTATPGNNGGGWKKRPHGQSTPLTVQAAKLELLSGDVPCLQTTGGIRATQSPVHGANSTTATSDVTAGGQIGGAVVSPMEEVPGLGQDATSCEDWAAAVGAPVAEVHLNTAPEAVVRSSPFVLAWPVQVHCPPSRFRDV